MKRYLPMAVLTAVFVFSLSVLKAGNDTLHVYYFENYPFSYTEQGMVKGIEVDIVAEYVKWMKSTKNTDLVVDYKAFSDFNSFYMATKNGPKNGIGLGSVTISQEREKEVNFSPPYMKNIAVLVTDGHVPTVREKSAAEVGKNFVGLEAIVIKGSSHVGYINDLKKQYLPTLKMNFVANEKGCLEAIAENPKLFGYSDIVAFWAFLKKNPGKFLKIQKQFSRDNETMGFVLPKTSVYQGTLSEFFESGFGFTSTKLYEQILEKYLGFEILESVEVE